MARELHNIMLSPLIDAGTRVTVDKFISAVMERTRRLKETFLTITA